MDQAKPLGPMLRVSLGLAVAAFGTGLIALGRMAGIRIFDSQLLLLPVSLGLSVGWIGVLVAAVIRRRLRSPWLLVGLPLAVAWPIFILYWAFDIWVCFETNQKGCFL